MNRRMAIGLASVLPLLVLAACKPTPRSSGALPQDVYVWQRSWSTDVTESVRNHARSFARVVVLAGEIDLRGPSPRWTPAHPDFSALRSPTQPVPVGVALRVGTFSGPFATDDARTRYLRRTAREILDRTRAVDLAVSEFQIDFDCPERHLDGYRVWVEALKRELAPLPVVFTALPSWLGRRAFRALADASDGFVLQVHSLARPKDPRDPVPLCDPAAALAAVERAAREAGDVRFRVALPTYGYHLAYAPDGAFAGASAEGPLPDHRPGTTFRELKADPVAMASLVARWTTDRPAAMTGLIWYRLPVPGDRLNWRWPTLAKVMQGQPPETRWTASARISAPGLADIVITNSGTADLSEPVAVRVRWAEARRIGADGIRGFEVSYPDAREVLFTEPICRLPAGEESRIGWVRLDAPVLFTVEVATPPPPTSITEPPRAR